MSRSPEQEMLNWSGRAARSSASVRAGPGPALLAHTGLFHEGGQNSAQQK